VTTSMIEARGLTAGYGSMVVVRDLDLRVDPGEVVALLGANGAGKTTTILTLAGELGPLGGDVLWRGKATKAPLHRRAKDGLGLITEDRAVLMTMTVAENLRVSRCDVARVLDLFPELTDHLHRRVGLLSGGQQQMLALGRSLGRNASVILADELSMGLAPVVVDRLLATLRAAADAGTGVLLVEQHVHKALEVADRVYVLVHSRVTLTAPAAELRGNVDEVLASYFATDAVPA
jgi:branched-chain amino acid transport system ATP-binding protein